MIIASPTADIDQDKPVTTTFPAKDAHEQPVEVSQEDDRPVRQRPPTG